MKTFPKEIKLAVYEAQNGICKNCLKPIDKKFGFHHRLPNNKPNRAKFKYFLNSPMNCTGLCFSCHEKKAHLFKITTQEAEVYEEWLRNLICDMPFSSGEANGITYQKIGRG